MPDVPESTIDPPRTPPPPRRGRRARRRRTAWIAAAGVATAAVVAVVLILASGGDESAPSATASEGRPVAGGKLTLALPGTQVSIDPAVAATAVTGLIDRNIFDSLVVQAGPDSFEPWLATSWEISPDGRTYTFKLRDDVKFHDGTPFNAEAVKASLEHVVDPETKSAYAASLIAPFESAEVIDDRTIEITLKRPFRPFLQALSVPYLGIQSPAALAKPAKEYEPVGTGPFSFVSWTPDKSVVLKRAPEYTSAPATAKHEGPAHLDELTFEFVAEDATRYGALTSGQIDAIWDVPPVNVEKLRSTEGFRVLDAITPGLNFNLFLNQKRAELRDPLVRKALSASVDVDGLVDSIYFGAFQPAKNPLGSTTAGFDETAEQELLSYDPEEAGRLLDEAGWTGRDAEGYRTKDGRRLEVLWPYWAEGNKQQRDVLAEGIQDQAKKVGIDIKRPTVDTGTFVDALTNGKYDLVDVSFARPTPDVLRFAFDSKSTYENAGANVALVDSPQIDKWVNDAAAASDADEANRNYAATQHEVLKQAYVLPLYTPVQLLGVADKVKGLEFDAQTYPTFSEAWTGS